ncbi:MAG: hypothetical protein CMN79_00875, partial [Spirochaetales bacterium]|nr:hypothetical protein [Spirochaetales bacterium]
MGGNMAPLKVVLVGPYGLVLEPTICCYYVSYANSVYFFFLMVFLLVSSNVHSSPRCLGNPEGWTDCNGTLFYPDGSKYAGEFYNGMFHGKGVFTYPDGGEYIGQWNDNEHHGKGTMKYAHG